MKVNDKIISPHLGEYHQGKKHGLGKIRFADGSTYEGQFYQNDIHGKGLYLWPDNKSYDGEWLHNKMHGKGTIKWSDGNIIAIYLVQEDTIAVNMKMIKNMVSGPSDGLMEENTQANGIMVNNTALGSMPQLLAKAGKVSGLMEKECVGLTNEFSLFN